MQFTGKTIANLRKQAGFTQATLAEKLGISDKAISKWERGVAYPDISLWNKLSILLDTDIESLIYGQEVSSVWKGILVLDEDISPNIIIYNKPLIHYLLSQFLLVGITDILIIGNIEQIDIPGVKLEIKKRSSWVNQQFSCNVFVIWGNNFLYGPNLTKHFKRAMSRTEGITLIAFLKSKGQYPLSIDMDRKVCLSNDISINQYYAESYLFIPCKTSISYIQTIEDVLNYKNLNAETMERGMLSFRITTYEEALILAEYVRVVEQNTGERIGCIEEILIRRGIANYQEVCKICDKNTKNYLSELFI